MMTGGPPVSGNTGFVWICWKFFGNFCLDVCVMSVSEIFDFQLLAFFETLLVPLKATMETSSPLTSLFVVPILG